MRLRLCLPTLLAAFGIASAAPAEQETWFSSLTPGELLYVGSAHTLPHGPLWFTCGGTRAGTGGTPFRGDILETAAPYTLTVELRHEALGPATGADARADLRIGVGDTVYRLPPLRSAPARPRISWSVHLSMSDAMLVDIMDGGPVTVFAGDTVLSRHDGDIGQHLSETIGFCIEEHLRTGLPVPDHAADAVARMRARAPGGATAPLTERRMRDHVAAQCAAEAVIDPQSVVFTELNGDDRPDAVLFWGGVDCLGGPRDGMIGAGNCGASQCLTSVFVSGTGRGSLPDAELFSQGPVLDAARPGLVGFGLRLAVCREAGLMPDCVTWHRWTAAGLARVE